jgi:hypothetical protein
VAITGLFYRVRIRNRANTADLLVLSSDPAAANCLLTAAPSGEGQRIDPIQGTSEIGAYTWRAWDRDEGGSARTITKTLADAFARNQGALQPRHLRDVA